MSNWTTFQAERLRNAEAEIKRLRSTVEMYERLDKAYQGLAGGISQTVGMIHEYMDDHSKGENVQWHIVARKIRDRLIHYATTCNDNRTLAAEIHFEEMKKL